MSNYGFIRVAAASPILKIADPVFNANEIKKMIMEADSKETAVLVFPELSITGYTCGDLFAQKLLLEKTLNSLAQLLEDTKNTNVLSLVGIPLLIQEKLYNCAVAVQQGHIHGVVPKTYLPNYKEFYEKRWFSGGVNLSKRINEISLLDQKVPFGHLLFKNKELGISLGIEICEDLWAVIPPSSYMALHGANILVNLSASNELVSKSDYRKQLVLQQSARCISAYIYASAGVHESSTDVVFGNECMIAENGSLLKSSERFTRNGTMIYAEIDVDRLASERQVNTSFAENFDLEQSKIEYQGVEFSYGKAFHLESDKFERYVPAYPFIPENPLSRNERCEEIFNIQVTGLAKRVGHTGTKHAVIGISGGLDSTLALLVTTRTFELLGLPPENILAVTMPGFGTTDTTYGNAMELMKSLKVTIREVDIRPACQQHFKDIGHDENIYDITYENTQARERTQILMNIANKVNGLVIGTGDLSELALGWCTYNGDHMSMYGVNSGVPKTLVRFLVTWVKDNLAEISARDVLQRVLETPISPELLPPDVSGDIKQKTEETIGPYELHDFFLYYMVRHGMPPKKIHFLAGKAFGKKYSGDQIKKWLRLFYLRFFNQQFKRSCLPDGPKVGTISLSPRGDWRMPSDAEVRLWLAELE